MDEYIWRRILGSDGGETALAVVFLVALFAVAIWQPHRITRPTLFRTAYVLFALTVLFPALTEVVYRIAVLETPRDASGRREPFGVPFLVASIITLVGRAVFVISIICAFASLAPTPRNRAAEGPGA